MMVPMSEGSQEESVDKQKSTSEIRIIVEAAGAIMAVAVVGSIGLTLQMIIGGNLGFGVMVLVLFVGVALIRYWMKTKQAELEVAQ